MKNQFQLRSTLLLATTAFLISVVFATSVWSQDEASCVVFGMPQVVEKAGLSDRVLPLDQIGTALSKVV